MDRGSVNIPQSVSEDNIFRKGTVAMGPQKRYLFVLSGVDYFDKTYIGKKDEKDNPWDHLVSLCFSSTTPSGAVKNTFSTYRTSDTDFQRIWIVIGGMGFTDKPTKAEVLYKIEELRKQIPSSRQFWIAWWHDNHVIPHECNTIDSISPNKSKRFTETWNDTKGFPTHYYEAKAKHAEKVKLKAKERKDGVVQHADM